MFGLAVIAAFALYLAASVGITLWVFDWARRNQRRAWFWGGITAVAMYHLVFWDFIPTLLVHRYYCATEAGFWVYKTPEQWRLENPSVVIYKPAGLGKRETIRNGERVYLNNRFVWEQTNYKPIESLSTVVSSDSVIDRETSEVLMTIVVISSGYGSIGLGRDVRALRFWLSLDLCAPGLKRFSELKYRFSMLGVNGNGNCKQATSACGTR